MPPENELKNPVLVLDDGRRIELKPKKPEIKIVDI